MKKGFRNVLACILVSVALMNVEGKLGASDGDLMECGKSDKYLSGVSSGADRRCSKIQMAA